LIKNGGHELAGGFTPNGSMLDLQSIYDTASVVDAGTAPHTGLNDTQLNDLADSLDQAPFDTSDDDLIG